MNQLHRGGAPTQSGSSHYIKLILCAIIALMLIQLVACSQQLGREKDGSLPLLVSLDATETSSSGGAAAKETGLPFVLLRQQSSSSSSSSGSSGGPKPDIILFWLTPYQSFIPKPVMSMIDQQVRPQTEQISQQVLSAMPGGQEFWAQLSQLQSTISNMGGLSSVLSSMTGTAKAATSNNHLESRASNPLSAALFGRPGSRR